MRSQLCSSTASDGHPERQPIFLTTEGDNPNGASIVIMVDGVAPDRLDGYERCLDMFDGTDPAALDAARGRWKAHQAEGRPVTYWEQAEGGKWEQRA